MFPFFNQTPFFYPAFYFVDPTQTPPQQFQSMMLPYGLMTRQLQTQNQAAQISQTIQNQLPNQAEHLQEPAHESPMPELSQKEEEQKLEITQNSQAKKQTEKKKKGQKPKRPLTYLTQKSYYMKQKLIGKMKSDKRELRRRIRPKHEKKVKSQDKNKEQLQKKLVKNEKKMKKICKQAITKIKKPSDKQEKKGAWIYVESQAKLPFLLEKENKLAQFISKKKFNLLQRKVS